MVEIERTTSSAFGRREIAEVGGGELQSVEDDGRSLRSQGSDGEGVDDDGDGELDGLGVLEGVKLDVELGDEAFLGGLAEAIVLVALMETIVEEAVVTVLECG